MRYVPGRERSVGGGNSGGSGEDPVAAAAAGIRERWRESESEVEREGEISAVIIGSIPRDTRLNMLSIEFQWRIPTDAPQNSSASSLSVAHTTRCTIKVVFLWRTLSWFCHGRCYHGVT